MPRFAANLTMMFTEWNFLDRFAAAADAGFGAVEFLFPYDHDPETIAACLKDNHLSPALFNMPPGHWDRGERGLACLPDRRSDFESSVQNAIHYARIIGVPHLHMMAGIGGAGDPQARARYRDALTWAAGEAGKAKLDILIEPLNPIDMPGYFLNSFDLAESLISELCLPNVKLQYDIYHRQILHGDVIRGLQRLLPMIGHIQIASVPKRQEPGTGELNDFALFRLLDELGYTGFVGCEYRPAKDTLAGLGWLRQAEG